MIRKPIRAKDVRRYNIYSSIIGDQPKSIPGTSHLDAVKLLFYTSHIIELIGERSGESCIFLVEGKRCLVELAS